MLRLLETNLPSTGIGSTGPLALVGNPQDHNASSFLLRRQHGKCQQCGLRFRAEDIMEVHHIDQNKMNNVPANLTLLHGHCHDEAHRKWCS